MARVTYLSGHTEWTEVGQNLFDVSGREIDNVDLVAGSSQPRGVDPGASADIHYPRRRRLQVASQDLLGAKELETSHPSAQSILLADRLVMPDDRLFLAHGTAPYGSRKRVALDAMRPAPLL
jgi:hypothetical protein